MAVGARKYLPYQEQRSRRAVKCLNVFSGCPALSQQRNNLQLGVWPKRTKDNHKEGEIICFGYMPRLSNLDGFLCVCLNLFL